MSTTKKKKSLGLWPLEVQSVRCSKCYRFGDAVVELRNCGLDPIIIGFNCKCGNKKRIKIK